METDKLSNDIVSRYRRYLKLEKGILPILWMLICVIWISSYVILRQRR